MRIKVIIADDHAILRDGLKAILQTHPSIDVVGDAADGLQAVALVEKLKPDVVVMDISMPHLNGIQATEQIMKFLPDCHVLVLSMHSTSEHIHRAMRAGARGYLLKESAGQEVTQAVLTVHDGHFYLSQKISDTLLGDFNARPVQTGASLLERLSEREREVFQQVVEGKTSLEIATRLHLSVKTVDTYRSRIMQKLEVNDLASLIKFAIQNGVISLD